MSNNAGLANGMWEAFINYVYKSGDMSVPSEFHERCQKVDSMLDNDITGIVSTICNYAVNSASEAILKVECSDNTMEEIFNLWLSRINITVNGIPTGLQELAREYYKERWEGSSLCLMRVSNWEKITVGNTSVSVPTVLWFVNGASVYIKRLSETNYKLGSDKYFLDEKKEIPVPKDKNEEIVVSKPFSRWFSKYPNIYLVSNGVLKNWLAIQMLASKGDEVISKVLPYLLLMEKGTEREFLEGDVNIDDADLKEMAQRFKEFLQSYKNEKSKVPTYGIPFDQKITHLIPDLKNILSEELYRQGYRAMLAGLGFIAVVQGVGDTRKEEVLNPKPFIAEVNSGVSGFKSMLIDVIQLIIEKNKIDHRKIFSDKNTLEITNSPLKINVESILDELRSGFVYGAVSYPTYQEALGLNPEQEAERADKDWKNGNRERFYPHMIQNREDIPDNTKEEPISKKQIEKKQEEQTQPKNMQKSFVKGEQITIKPGKYAIAIELSNEKKWVQDGYCEWNTEQNGYIYDEKFNVARFGVDGYVFVNIDDLLYMESNLELEIAPYKKDNPPTFLKKYPQGAQEVFIDVFNNSLPKGEDYAYPVAWKALNLWMKKHGYKKVENKWVKEEK